MERKVRVLLGSPIHQKPPILREFLASLLRLKLDGIALDYYLIDDNDDAESSAILQAFQEEQPQVLLQPSGHRDTYVRDDTTHFWNANLIWKVANFKNLMIRRADSLAYDYLFLLDSDLVLHPDTLKTLIAADKEIVSEIFWTAWQPDKMLQPQVWMHDEYNQWELLPGEQLQQEEIHRRFQAFIARMQVPGLYEVGGLGACTLISRRAITAGVNYDPLKNLSYWGEDRHFCIRAAALGIPLFVDTHYPALHLYRESDLEKVADFIIRSSASALGPRARPKLTLSMVVKNESERFLRQVLEEHRKYIDEAVIIDDGSTDDTPDLCLEVLKGIPVRLIRNTRSKFSNEIELRRQQWEEVIKTDPEWILNLDGDEIFEARFAEEIDTLLTQEQTDLFCFRLYDMWSEDHYREDQYWRSHHSYRPFLLRYKKDFHYTWHEAAQHCGRFPNNIFELPHQLSGLRLKHLGWSRIEFRLEKYLRYMHLDPEGKYGWKEQYLSILDQYPNLVPWDE